MSPAHGPHWRVACPQPVGHKPQPRAVPGSWETQPPEKYLRHLWRLPPCTTRLPMLLGVRVQVCDAGTKSLWGRGAGRGQTPSLSPEKPQELQGEGFRAPWWVLGPPPHPGHSRCHQRWGWAWSWTLVSLSPKLPMGSQDPSCPHHSPMLGQDGLSMAPRQQAGTGIMGGPDPQPRSGWVFLSPILSLKLAHFPTAFSR